MSPTKTDGGPNLAHRLYGLLTFATDFLLQDVVVLVGYPSSKGAGLLGMEQPWQMCETMPVLNKRKARF